MLTDEQLAIVELVRRGEGNLLISAVAGSGKTFALREALKTIPQRSILVCAFNRKIVDDWKANGPKLPKTHVVHIQTFHGIGGTILQSHYPKLRVPNRGESSGTETIVNQANGNLSFPVRRAATRLLRQLKESEAVQGIGAALDPEDILEMGTTYELFDKCTPGQRDQAVEACLNGYDLSLRPAELPAIDFCDMIWMPIALDLMPKSRYQAIIVDEWQDIAEPQWNLINKMRAPSVPVPGKRTMQPGRLIMAGDDRQAINDWRGADAAMIREQMVEQHKAREMTLTTSFRCSHAVIKAASELVPNIRACDDALEGSVSTASLNDLTRMILEGTHEGIDTFILSRSNAPLLDTALYLWRGGVRFQLNAGQEMLDPLFKILDTLELSRVDKFRESLDKWHAEMVARCEEANAVAARERVDEQYQMLMAVVKYVEPRGIRGLLKSILEPGKSGVLMSTVHKVKGLEARRVFLLKQTFKRHRTFKSDIMGALEEAAGRLEDAMTPRERQILAQRRATIAPSQEDLNIEYVAITRAREHLIWVDIDDKQAAVVPEKDLEADLIKSLTLRQLEVEHAKAEGEMQRLARTRGDEAQIAEWARYAERLQAEISARAYRYRDLSEQ